MEGCRTCPRTSPKGDWPHLLCWCAAWPPSPQGSAWPLGPLHHAGRTHACSFGSPGSPCGGTSSLTVVGTSGFCVASGERMAGLHPQSSQGTLPALSWPLAGYCLLLQTSVQERSRASPFPCEHSSSPCHTAAAKTPTQQGSEQISDHAVRAPQWEPGKYSLFIL